MPLSKEHKARTRQKILNTAANLFRQLGYDGVGVDTIMKTAGLTRGGFYAHFRSKADLFQEILQSQHDLIRRLSARTEAESEAHKAAGAEIFRQYLSFENFDLVAPNCTLSTLNMDASRAPEESRSAFTDAIRHLHSEIARTPDDEPHRDLAQCLNIASLAVGALSLARASDDQELCSQILNSARDQVSDWFETLT